MSNSYIIRCCHRIAAVSIAVLLGIAIAAPVQAAVKPGDFITSTNATKVQGLVSPGTYYKVQRGMTMKIIPTE